MEIFIIWITPTYIIWQFNNIVWQRPFQIIIVADKLILKCGIGHNARYFLFFFSISNYHNSNLQNGAFFLKIILEESNRKYNSTIVYLLTNIAYLANVHYIYGFKLQCLWNHICMFKLKLLFLIIIAYFEISFMSLKF